MKKLLLLHGPNLNLLGSREPEIYGRATLAEINADCQARAEARGYALEAFQSNSEGALLDRLHQAAQEGVSMVIINPGAFTHTSVALRDGLLGVALPFIEVHLSNVHAREAFRRHSYLSDVAIGVITGFGIHSYLLAIDAAVARLDGNAAAHG
jgi:3-dehydroquinate dehydratase-2